MTPLISTKNTRPHFTWVAGVFNYIIKPMIFFYSTNFVKELIKKIKISHVKIILHYGIFIFTNFL